MRPFPPLEGKEYILVVVDCVQMGRGDTDEDK